MKMSAGGAGQEHAFGMSGLWSGATLHQPAGDANFDGGNGQRTGWGSGPSVDQIVALRNGANAPVPARRHRHDAGDHVSARSSSARSAPSRTACTA